MGKTIIITGASSGFGALTARALAADDGHTVYAGMRDVTGEDASAAADVEQYGHDHSVALSPLAMDVTDDAMVKTAVERVIVQTGRLDVVIHNAGHMVLGPAEAFTVEQLAETYDINVLSAQRVNRAALPHLRSQRAKAAEDALAVSYAAELARFGIEITIVRKGSRPFRVHIDPMHDGAEEVFDLGDKIRAEFFQRIGFDDLLHPAT